MEVGGLSGRFFILSYQDGLTSSTLWCSPSPEEKELGFRAGGYFSQESVFLSEVYQGQIRTLTINMLNRFYFCMTEKHFFFLTLGYFGLNTVRIINVSATKNVAENTTKKKIVIHIILTFFR